MRNVGKGGRGKIEQRVEAVKRRIDEIETRFPAEATLDKVASINDAILATKIEALSAEVERLQSNLITKWDVATIIFLVLGALGGLILSLRLLSFSSKDLCDLG